MSLQLLAKQMESKGRKGDSMLVHMTAKEADALQKMAESAGGSLSVNPETGLLEANFLKKMLPTLVGIGVGMFAGPMAGAAAGAAVGGYQAKRNDQDVGMGMLMGGLGGYGGAGIGAGLGAAGAPAAASAAAPAAATTAATTAAPMTAAQTFAQAGQGIKALGADELKRAAFFEGVGKSGLGMAAAPMMAPDRFAPEEEADTDMPVYDYEMNPTGASTTGSGMVRHFNPRFVRRAADGGMMATGGMASMAQGGPSHLGDYSDGGRLLRGPGDGVSDDIPASIGDKQPARLADGEFVVPARIVSELGNGSTEAGARKLYAMMDRVQKARKKSIGKDRVAVNSRSEKLLPA